MFLSFFFGWLWSCSAKNNAQTHEQPLGKIEENYETATWFGHIQQLESGEYVLSHLGYKGAEAKNIYLVTNRESFELSSLIDKKVKIRGEYQNTEGRRRLFIESITLHDYFFVSDLAIDIEAEILFPDEKGTQPMQSIHVFDRNREIQVLLPSHPVQQPEQPFLAVPSFVDVNFDGKLDILSQQYSDHRGNARYDAWITKFLPEQEPFFRFDVLDGYSKIMNPKPNATECSITSFSEEGTDQYTTTFRIFDGKLQRFSQVHTNEKSNPKVHVQTVRIGDGMVNVSPPREIRYSQILEVVQSAYEWQFSSTHLADYPPKETLNDDITGLDEHRMAQRIAELRDSELFSDKFIQQYEDYVLNIHEGLKEGRLIWKRGVQPSFMNKGDPWCHCQDYPESFWEWLSLHNLEVLSVDSVSIRVAGFFSLSQQSGQHTYRVELILRNGKWRIDSLQGFSMMN